MKLESNRTYIMGILNVTPDSFSDGGSYISPAMALDRALRMVEEGADIIDIGGESTRPGAVPVSADEELRRVLPAIEAIAGRVPVPISIDTYKASVARAALSAGAAIVNDVWGFKRDPDMCGVAAEHGCGVILMHNRCNMDYQDLLADISADLLESVDIARSAGVSEDRIWLDPGIGFAKTREHNLAVMRSLDRIVQLGYPVVLGTSRKRFIRDTLKAEPDDVLEGTIATCVLGQQQGCRILRVHDVREVKRAAAMVDAILYER